LLDRGARHHIFSAIAANAPAAIEALLEDESSALERRLSRFEHAETPLHFAARCGSRETVELLLRLGAEVEAVDDRGRTPLATALLSQRSPAAEALRAAGAREPERAASVAFEHVTPILPSHDVGAAITYYQARLGFEKRWEWGEPTSFACVARDDVTIFLGSSEHQGPPGVGVFIDVEAVDALHREYQQRGAKIREAPADRPWGSREMVVEDLDGNKLRLAT
jgi:uncharacterized glyoxalase superfamily protein PhnB